MPSTTPYPIQIVDSMAKPYKRMFVLTEDEYLRYKSSLNQTIQPTHSSVTTVACPQDGREFPNAQMLGHHLKTHVRGFQCNICSKAFKSKRALAAHLKRHAPQVQPSTHSIFDKSSPTSPQSPPENIVKHKKVHKQRRSTLNFTSSKWLSLK